MTEQEIFDTVVTHLRKQGCKAIAARTYGNGPGKFETKGCMYRTPDGLKCAAGCLITDKDYDPKFEFTGVANRLSFVGKYFMSRFSSDEISLIRELQDIHDHFLTSDWESAFTKLAARHGLTYTTLTLGNDP